MRNCLFLNPQSGIWTPKQPAWREGRRRRCLLALARPNKATQEFILVWLTHLTPWVTSKEHTGISTNVVRVFNDWYITDWGVLIVRYFSRAHFTSWILDRLYKVWRTLKGNLLTLDVDISAYNWASTCSYFLPPFLCPDQRDPDNFCHLRQRPRFLAATDRTHTLWHQLEETDHLKQTHETRAVPSGDRRRAKPLALCDHVFTCKILPTKKNSYISLSARSVLLLNNQTLQSPPTVCGNCLVPKLNWRMHCNSSCFCLSFFSFLFIMLWSYTVYI